MPKASKSGPPGRGSKWSPVWNHLINKLPIVEDERDRDTGWGFHKCEDEKEARLCQSALHQRSLRETSSWRVQTQLVDSTIYFRRVRITDDEQAE